MRRLNSEDHGASMVFIAICLVFLIGFAGLAVDVGALYVERTELQKGAEAAVLAIAEDCGHGTKPCDVPTATATAEDYIDANATDLAGAVDSLDLDTVGQTVTVIDQTERTDGGSIFLPFFAQVIGFEGTTVRAQASAAWGYPSSLSTFPLIISDCEWRNYGNPESWPSEPDFDTPPIIFTFQTGNVGGSTPECNAVAGQDVDGDGKLDGNFGALQTGTADCEAETTVGSWSDGDAGAAIEDQCDAAHLEALIDTIIFIPWFNDEDGATGSGSGADYLVGGYSPFYLTGYNLGGQLKHDSVVSDGPVQCGPSAKCIEGYLVKATATEGELGGEYRGVLVVKLTG